MAKKNVIIVRIIVYADRLTWFFSKKFSKNGVHWIAQIVGNCDSQGGLIIFLIAVYFIEINYHHESSIVQTLGHKEKMAKKNVIIVRIIVYADRLTWFFSKKFSKNGVHWIDPFVGNCDSQGVLMIFLNSCLFYWNLTIHWRIPKTETYSIKHYIRSETCAD